MFVMIAIAVWACALVIWWVCSNAFRHSDIDKLKSRLIGTSKTKAQTTTSSMNVAWYPRKPWNMMGLCSRCYGPFQGNAT